MRRRRLVITRRQPGPWIEAMTDETMRQVLHLATTAGAASADRPARCVGNGARRCTKEKAQRLRRHSELFPVQATVVALGSGALAGPAWRARAQRDHRPSWTKPGHRPPAPQPSLVAAATAA